MRFVKSEYGQRNVEGQVKKVARHTYKISRQEWESIGKTAGWKPVTAQTLENVKALDSLTERELTRAIRDAIVAEEGAINQYETIVDSIDNEKAKKVLQSIADEERVHVGELQELLNGMLPDEEEKLEEGAGEVNVEAAGKKKMYQPKQEQEKEEKSINPQDLMKSRKPPIPKGNVIAPKKGKGSKYDRRKWKNERD